MGWWWCLGCRVADVLVWLDGEGLALRGLLVSGWGIWLDEVVGAFLGFNMGWASIVWGTLG